MITEPSTGPDVTVSVSDLKVGGHPAAISFSISNGGLGAEAWALLLMFPKPSLFNWNLAQLSITTIGSATTAFQVRDLELDNRAQIAALQNIAAGTSAQLFGTTGTIDNTHVNPILDSLWLEVGGNENVAPPNGGFTLSAQVWEKFDPTEAQFPFARPLRGSFSELILGALRK